MFEWELSNFTSEIMSKICNILLLAGICIEVSNKWLTNGILFYEIEQFLASLQGAPPAYSWHQCDKSALRLFHCVSGNNCRNVVCIIDQARLFSHVES